MNTCVELGREYRDRITGLCGVAVARTEWLYGCVRVSVQPRDHKDGKLAELQTFDEPQLDLVEAPPVDAPAAQKTGGPRTAISRRPDILR